MKSLHQILAGLLLAAFGFVTTPVQAADPVLGDWALIEFNGDQTSIITCNVVGGSIIKYFDRLECGFLHASITQDGLPIAQTSSVTYEIERPNGSIWITEPGVYRTVDSRWQLSFEFCNDYLAGFCAPALPAGEYTVRLIQVNGVFKNFGELKFTLNGMTATSLAASASPIAPGQAVTINGVLNTIDEEPVTTQSSMVQQNPVGGTFDVEVVDSSNNVLGTILGESAAVNGTFSFNVPGSFTNSLTTNQTISVRIINADYNEVTAFGTTENWHADVAGQVGVAINTGIGGGGDVTLHNSFVSGVGWVKPGETYPWRVFVENTTSTPLSNAIVTIPAVDGMTFTNVTPLGGAGTAVMGGGSLITWNIGSVPQFSRVTLVVEAVADTAVQDPRIVWKDLSTTATLTWGSGLMREDASHGPKVIPPLASYNSARFGDRPYVVVPADYTDRKHDPAHTGDALEAKLNDPNLIGSTFNLWQENSFKQLYPNGAIGSAGVATADFTVDWNDPTRTDDEFTFSNNLPGGTCTGTDLSALAGTAAYPERISGGWYQLPRDTGYYGSDKYGSAWVVAQSPYPLGVLFAIDDGCGPTGKAVYDAAHIADPEIDYNEYDSDKDGVVDFFMLVYVGVGGHGASQTSIPPYDNIWPHSSSLEFQFTDANGLKGYVSDDQLKSLTEVPQCWTNTTRTAFDDCAANGGTGDDLLPTYVRVGPYNVNPESSIDKASVISHEYGHSLGLPDFYCRGKGCYGDWNLMATDKSHHMDIFAKQELGWIVPVPLQPGQTIANGWRESKFDTGEIHWQQPDGTPYTLSAVNGDQNIHNAEAYVAKLPPALVISPDLVGSTEPGHDASLDNVWWSGAGNDFGCPGHTFDFVLSPQEAPAGSTVEIEFGSWWEIEWDWDYGFVLVSTDLGVTWQSLASNNAYTTPGVFNPNANGCQQQYGNGLTGTSGSYLGATDALDRANGTFTPATRFTTDSYTYTMPAGGDQLMVRFAYATDPAVAGRGWFIDNLRVSVDGTQVFSSDFETNGQTGNGRWAGNGWSLISATLGSQADRAYYLEMRDRTGFDHTGNGENARSAIAFQPGLLLVITDEVIGYGNTGSGDFPNQSPVDASPQASSSPNLNDAAFRDAPGVSQYSDNGPVGWIDNYADDTEPDGRWHHRHNCLSFNVTAMTGETTIGPNYPIPGDLTGDVTFNVGPVGEDNCGEFIYWPPTECFDTDADGMCDPEDNCPLVSNVDQLDQDGDGVGDLCDNCLLVENPDQCNTNSHIDNFGNVCDADLDNNGITNSFDLSIMRDNFGAMGSGNDADLNCNDIVNSFDLTIMRERFGTAPGPTGIQ